MADDIVIFGGSGSPRLTRKICEYLDVQPGAGGKETVLMATTDVISAIEQSHKALGAIVRGDPTVFQALYSLADDVTLGNSFGPYVRGRQKVEATLAGAASHYRDGEVTDVELIAKYTSDTLACVVEVERGRSKVGGADEVVPLAVRTTSVFRLESGSWKLVHRHADPITTPRPAASVISR
jgi:ketosteroid isomerase-like protein